MYQTLLQVMQKLKGGDPVNQVGIWGKVVQAKGTVSAKAP